MSDELATRIARLETTEAARNLVAAYADLIDRSDVASLDHVFTPDAVLTTARGNHHGLSGLGEFFGSHFAAAPLPRRHFITNTRVLHADAETAECDSYFLYTTASGANSIIGWGRYRDTMKRVDGQLRIASKDITMDFVGPIASGWADELAAIAKLP